MKLAETVKGCSDCRPVMTPEAMMAPTASR